ncbi:hypothetical protein VTP01DRAFT_9261 [Rhizomucor pusillus]|uniref:uncharacterized protein n=1 Tax=Rhizomucor pusillus TaxID=4840 RepID=UPI0037441B93
MAAFLRPSDLHRIDLQASSVDSQRRLKHIISSPKERRDGRQILKSVRIHPHGSNSSSCPVTAFEALRDHPAAQTRPCQQFFVKSRNPADPLELTTISAWLRGIVKKSTDLKPLLSVQGNWSSSAVFDQHYRRQRL